MTVSFSIDGAASTATFTENAIQSEAQTLFGDVTFATTLTGGATLNLNGGSLTLDGAAEDDLLSIRNQGDGAGEIGFDGGFVTFGGTQIATVTGGYDGYALGIDFNANATAAAVEALVENLTFKSASDTPTENRTLTLALTDGDGNNLSPTAGTLAQYERADLSSDPLSGLSYGTQDMIAMDFNNDGILDTAGGISGTHMIFARLSNAGGTPTNVTDLLEFPEPANPDSHYYASLNDLAPVDFDGDGDLDVVASAYNPFPHANYTLHTFRNNGDGSFTYLEGAANPYAGIDLGNSLSITFADLDNDGDDDFIGIDSTYTIRTWLQASDGSFAEATGTDNPFNGLRNQFYTDPAFVDIDHDGDLDAILNDMGSTVYLNDGTGGFTPLTGANPLENVANNGGFGAFDPEYDRIQLAGDFDGDGDIDLYADAAMMRSTLFNITPANPTISITVTAEDDPTESYGIPEEMAADEDTITTLDLTEFSITDPDADGPKTITLTASTGILSSENAADVTITGQGTGELRLTGLIEDLSFFLSGEGAVSYQGAEDDFGDDAATIAVAVIDGETTVPLGEVSVHIAEQWDDRYVKEDGMAEGDAGRDSVYGSEGADRLYGYAGTDALDGGAGNDRLDGGEAADLMTGGLGNDAYFVDDTNDVVIEDAGFVAGGGIDTVHTSVNNYQLTTNTEILRMAGSSEMAGRGNDGDNVLVGNDAANTLSGGGGDDRLVGNGGADVLIGNAGADILVGGGGVDSFVFTSIADSYAGAGNRDTINGFLNLRETIDLSAIDANTYNGAATNDDWTFIGSRAFDGTWGDSAGQLRTQGLGDGVNAVLVEGDHNGDGVADFQILVNGTTWMTGSDFVL